MAAMPEVDWHALVRAEEAEIAAVGSLRVALAGAVVLAVVVAYKLLA